MKSIHPQLAGGIHILGTLSLFLLIEIATGLPLITKYAKYVGIGVAISIVFVYARFDSKYNREDNDDAKAFVIGIFLVLLLVVLVILYTSL